MEQQLEAGVSDLRPSVTLLDVVPRGRLQEGAAPSPGRVHRALDAGLEAKITELAQAAGCTPSDVACGAWLLVVDRLIGAPSVAIALESPASLGSGARVVRARVPDSGSVRNWLAGLARALAAGAASSESDEAAASCWAVMTDTPSASGHVLRAGVLPGGTPAIDFQEPWDQGSASSLLDAWCYAIGELARDPARDISDARVGPRAPSGAAAGSWAYRGPMNVAARFAEVVARHRAKPALRWNGGKFSYGELESKSLTIASALYSRGVRAGDVVALALPRSENSIIAVLAALRLGAAYLPVDVDYPADRLEFIFADAGVRLVVCAHGADSNLPADVTKLPIDTALASEPATLPALGGDGETLAYVMYTSGSTGQPKGVEIPGRAILRLVADTHFMRLDESLVMLHAAPLGFDASTLEIWGPLLNGGCCVLHDEAIPTGRGLARQIREHGVTSAWLTAALFNSVVDDDPAHLAGLRELLIGGEALSMAHVKQFVRTVPAVRLINGYGPTECTTFTTTHAIDPAKDLERSSIPIGKPITETQLYICNQRGEALPAGFVGELYVGGLGVARGYLKRPELTAERFVSNAFDGGATKLYRTGDLVRYLEDGSVEFIGRIDGQVKIRGFRIELGEVEAAVASFPGIRSSAVIAQKDPERGARLVAYVVPASPDYNATALRRFLAAKLPEFMIPAVFVKLDALPVTKNGKLDRKALPEPRRERPADLPQSYVAPATELEGVVARAFAEVLGVDRVGQLDNFFELGGNSLLALRAVAVLRTRLGRDVPTAVLFGDPTPRKVAAALDGADANLDPRRVTIGGAKRAAGDAEPIAVVGMAGRFPGARSVEALWQVLLEGRDTVRLFTREEIDPSISLSLLDDPSYVRARGVIDDVESFDAGFFGITPREAELMDPQQRIFLELCWECLERAGHVPEKYDGPIGVFGGMYNATYFQRHVMGYPEKIQRLGEFQVMLANEKDYVATRVANKLNLTGPAVSVHTACSTSLVAISMAFESLRAGQCKMVLAGGSSVTCPPQSGYLYQEGAMLSPDGHTRTFDAAAQGTVFSDGAAVILMKRLSDAIADGNEIFAVIKGVAVNNDGGDKASFTAPSVEGQSAVVAAALDSADVDARSISYVEAHGTATPLGDPVEVAALTKAYRAFTPDTGFCRIGSIKSNIGHTVIAAGATGVIKTALALHRGVLPTTAHFTTPNPKVDFQTSPFRVVDRLTPWARGETPRRAGVSSFGVGGTNAHVILEEAPARAESPAATGLQVLRLSARSRPALEQAVSRLADHLEAEPGINLADAAWTLEVGRRTFAERTFVVAGSPAEAIAALRDPARALRMARKVASNNTAVVFVYAGQGAQYAGMGSGLYDSDPYFREAFDEATAALKGVTPFDLKAAMFGDDAASLMQTAVTQPAMYALEYALVRAWIHRGVRPAAMIGHSVGEFVAATIADVMSLPDAIRLVARRGALMQALPAGSMLSVRLAASKLEALIPEGLQLASENGPTACVVAGPTARIEAFAAELAKQDIVARLLQTSHAFHSAMMDPAVAPFEREVRKIALRAPSVPIYSTLTGRLLQDSEATDPNYWARHLRAAVRFAPAVRTALETPERVFLELAPRGTLTTLIKQQGGAGRATPDAVACLADSPSNEAAAFANALGHLWSAGVALATEAAPERRRLLLPTYPFERQRYWLAAMGAPATAVAVAPATGEAVALPTSDSVTAPAPEPTNSPLPTLQPNVTIMTSPTASAPADRKPRLIAQLREVFEDVSGVEMEEADPSARFVELGLDSLTLTQISLQLKKKFAVSVTFRNLMENVPSLDMLAGFLDGKLPPEEVSVATPTPVASPTPAAPVAAPAAQPAALNFALPGAFAPAGGGAPASAIQLVIQQQMQIMAAQLALLGGAAPSVAAPVASAPSPAASVAASPPPSTARAAAAAPAAAAAVRRDGAPAAAAPDDESPTSHSKYDVKKAFGAIARIHTSGQALTERQQARLDAFMKRYIERTKKSKAYTVEYRSQLADPRVVNGFRPTIKEIIYQIVIERSKGSHMWDIDGNEYVDALSGFGMSFFGWQPDFIIEAVRKQIDLGYEIGPQHPLAGEVARLFCEVTGNDRAALCNTGSEAVMGCVRIARTITGRSKIAIFNGAYHGIFDEVIVRGTKKMRSIPAAPGIMPNTSENVVVLEYGTPESLQYLKDHADDFAAVLVEPVQSRRPDFQPKEFLKDLRKFTQETGSLLIFDEVVTGFRAHPGGIQALFDIRADLASYGKVVGGGFPIGVIAGKREFMDALDGGHWEYGNDSIPTVGVTYFAGTFVRHPLALAAAKAVLIHIKQHGPELQARVTGNTTAMVEELNSFCREVGAPIVLKSFASVWKVFFTEDHPLQDLLFGMMRSRGIHILDNFPCFFTTAHTAADIAQIKQAFKEAVMELQEADFIPGSVAAKVVQFDATKPPVPGARLGRDQEGRPAWFVANPDVPGKYERV